jgi:heat shock protein HslJ
MARRRPGARSGASLIIALLVTACATEAEDTDVEALDTADEVVSEVVVNPADTVALDPSLVDRPLEGTEWILESVFEQRVPAGSAAMLTFDRELERVTGHTACNPFTGAYELTGTRLLLSSFGLTRMACPGGFDQVEVDVLEAFRTTGSFRISTDVLELMGAQGAVARFRAREAR